jgi:hypothetical protein
MPSKKAKRVAYEIIEIKARGKTLGVIYASDEDEARARAIIDFRIRRPELVRLLIRRV